MMGRGPAAVVVVAAVAGLVPGCWNTGRRAVGCRRVVGRGVVAAVHLVGQRLAVGRGRTVRRQASCGVGGAGARACLPWDSASRRPRVRGTRVGSEGEVVAGLGPRWARCGVVVAGVGC